MDLAHFQPALTHAEPGAGAERHGLRGETLADESESEAVRSRDQIPWLSLWRRLSSIFRAYGYVGENGRDLRIDLLRGLAVLAMVVDHIAGPSKLYLLTGGNHFYTSAAEAFIFLSGLTVGLVYRRVIERQGLAIAMR